MRKSETARRGRGRQRTRDAASTAATMATPIAAMKSAPTSITSRASASSLLFILLA